MTETIQLTQVVLGLKPYVLIEADTDPTDGEVILKIKAGGGANEQIGALPFMMLTELPADDNPLMMSFLDVLDDHPEDRAALTRLAEYMGITLPDADDTTAVGSTDG